MQKKKPKERVIEKIEKDIHEGILSTGEKLPSLRSYAELCGVSHETVNNAFQILEARGFVELVPNCGAVVKWEKSIQDGAENKMFAVVVDMGRQAIPQIMLNSIYESITASVSHKLGLRNFQTLVGYICYNDEVGQQNLQSIVKSVDALIVVGLVNEKLRAYLADLSIPVVSVLSSIDAKGIDTVEIDEFQAFYDITTLLLEKGIRAPVFFEGRLTFRNAFLRYSGIQCACRNFDINFETDRIIESPEWNFTSYEAVLRNWLDKKIPFDAVIGANDNFASTALRVLSEKKIAVPDTVSVFGAKNTQIGKSSIPKLSTVDYHYEDLVELAISKIFSRFDGDKIRKKRTLLRGTIIERESSL